MLSNLPPTLQLLALTFFGLAIAWFFFNNTSSSNNNNHDSDGDDIYVRGLQFAPWVTKPIRRDASTNNDDNIMDHISLHHPEPVVVEGLVAEAWRDVFRKWRDSAYLEHELGNGPHNQTAADGENSDGRDANRSSFSSGIKVHESPLPVIRMHSIVNPLGALPNVTWYRPFTEALVEPWQVLLLQSSSSSSSSSSPPIDTDSEPHLTIQSRSHQREEDGINETWFYFFSPLSNLSVSLQNDVKTHVSPLLVSKERHPQHYQQQQPGQQTPQLKHDQPDPMEVNVWIGEPNVTTPMHFDAVHNAYVQVSGAKHFTLIPPWYWRCMHLFPRYIVATFFWGIFFVFTVSVLYDSERDGFVLLNIIIVVVVVVVIIIIDNGIVVVL